MSAPKEKDFGKSEPQISTVYKYRKPVDVGSIDDPESRADHKNPRARVLTDKGFDHEFTPEPEHTKEYDFGKKGKK